MAGNPDAPPDDPLALAPHALARRGSWTLRSSRPSGHDTPHPQWRAAYLSLFEHAVDALEARWPLPAGTTAHVVLDEDGQACLDWNVDEAALGFQGVLAPDPEGSDDVVLPDDHRCYLSLPAHALAMEDEPDDAHARLAALGTLGHEMAHVAWFARESGGLTPLGVFDSHGSLAALEDLQDRLEDQANDLVDVAGHEDAVEQFGRHVVDAWLSSVAGAPALLAAIPAGPAPSHRARTHRP